jgi:DNA polymerase
VIEYKVLKLKKMTIEEKEILNKTIADIKVCPKCRLSQTRICAVPGAGSETSDIMFVGEGPGKNEDIKGFPFVGAAGKLLDKLLESIELNREDVYITNVVKCRPPNNREPFRDEIEACLPYLRTQVKIIKPKVICTLGNSSARTLVLPDINISKNHGKFFKKKDLIFCTLYHPAAALYNQSLKDVLFEDFLKLGDFIGNEMKNFETEVLGDELSI